MLRAQGQESLLNIRQALKGTPISVKELVYSL